MYYRSPMRTFEVDERDSSWEIDTPRFRIYVFEGPQNAVTVSDVVDANVEQALEAGRTLSGKDSRLWSLALVNDDRRHGRGLVWLSGNDYNDVPASDGDTWAYWSARRTMQDRYLRARRQAGEPTVLPTGERVIRMFPEWSTGIPLWENFSDRNYPVEPGGLPIPAELETSLAAWNDRWQNLGRLEDWTPSPDDERSTWLRDGRVYLAQLRSALAGFAEVRPEFLRHGAALL